MIGNLGRNKTEALQKRGRINTEEGRGVKRGITGYRIE